MKRIAQALAATVLVAAGLAVAAYAGGNPHGDKVTICHAAGLAGTTHYVTLTIGHQAVYGPAGHFYENGTPQAGHEQDYLGPCKGDETETTPTETTPTTTTPTTPTETTPTTPTPECQPPNPDGTYGGQDGKPGNDRCKPDQPPVVTTSPSTPPVATPPAATTPPSVVTPPTVTPPATTPPKPKPPVKAKPEPKAPPKLTGNPKKDKCVPKAGLLHCKVGKDTITVVPGLG